MPIEQLITTKSTLIEALETMKEYKYWSDSTLSSYQHDVQEFENFLCDIGLNPFLENGRLDYVQKWIKKQKEEERISVSTIKRRIAALSSLYSFYRDLGIVSRNPFKVITLPVAEAGHHSPILTLEQLRQVYHYAELLQKEHHPAAMTIKTLIFTGLRNEALTNLSVKHIHLDKQWLKYEREYINSKHKVQIIPLPSKLLLELKEHIDMYQLQPNDSLLYGLNGHPLKPKALNRLTNHICEKMGWKGEERVTPHGFRATISTILAEKGVEMTAIKFLLGHSQQDNLKYYVRKNYRLLNILRREINRMEDELIIEKVFVEEDKNKFTTEDENQLSSVEITENHEPIISKEAFVQLIEKDPKLASILIEKKLVNL